MVFKWMNKQTLALYLQSSLDQYKEKWYGTKGKLNLYKDPLVNY